MARTIAIFGCGPAGLMAAHAASLAGFTPAIFSLSAPSKLYGCQYLHAPIPNLTMAEPVIVSYDRIGTADQYRRKVYGMGWSGEVSTQTLTREHAAWDIREAYHKLWDRYHKNIEHVKIDKKFLLEFPYREFFRTFSSIPAKILCHHHKHEFHSQDIYAFGETPTRKIEMDDFSIGGNHILCNGLDMPSWYRVSNVFGYATVEWPGWDQSKALPGSSRVEKPLSNDCECFPEIIRVGRYGRWEKGILTHHVMDQVWEILR